MWRAITAAAFALTALAGLSVPGSGHEGECEQQLRAARIETVAPPEGAIWEYLEWDPLEHWRGSIEGDRFAGLEIVCTDDAAATMARQRDVREALSDLIDFAVVEIGDETDAYLLDDYAFIVWRNLDVMARLSVLETSPDYDYGPFEDFATAIDRAPALSGPSPDPREPRVPAPGHVHLPSSCRTTPRPARGHRLSDSLRAVLSPHRHDRAMVCGEG